MIRAVPRAISAIALAILLTPAPVQGQPQPPAPPPPTPIFNGETDFAVGTTEWMVTFGPAWGIQLFHSAGGHDYLHATMSWARVLTRPKLRGWMRGQLEWAFELTPIFYQYQPDGIYGFGFTPLDWRWNFEPRGRYAPFVELAGGALKTTAPLPEATLSANFTAHAGVGVRVLLKSQQSLVIQYRFDHISNGNRVDKNPGVNAHAIHFGYSLLRPKN